MVASLSSRFSVWLWSAPLLLSSCALVLAEVTVLPETIVTAERVLAGDPALASWDRGDLDRIAPRTIDELLATEPSFSLFRRQSAMFGHPTSAGVSLRRSGATATARTLVLRDGIPQNDPFGGWVPWARYHPEWLSSVRIVPAAQAAAWGNTSPAGIIHLTSRELLENQTSVGLTGGSHQTLGFSAVSGLVSRDRKLATQIAASTLRSDGFYGLRESQRGAVDRRLHLETAGADVRAVWRPAEDLTIEPSLSYYDEKRGNGTVLSRNATEALDLSLRVTRETPSQTWQALAYYQRRDFESLFSSVEPGRNAESPALDQFDVPGEGIGGSVTATLHPGETIDVIVGADLRHLNGETNERAGFVDGAFLRQRRAGGQQLFGGVFARAAYKTTADLSLEASARLDFWHLHEGERVERHPATGALLRGDRFDDRSGMEPSLSVALGYQIAETVRLTASAGTAFRLPTINELYRPFRVRNDITEANADLDPERFFSVDAGIAWAPSDTIQFDLEVFHHWIRDAIANVPITDPAEAAALAGFVPPGGSVAQRRNVEEARVWGIESRAHWQICPQLALSLRYLYSHSEFTKSSGQSLLEGKRFPQAPRHRLVAGIESDPLDRVHLFAEVDFGSSQFDDALERRRLDSWWSTRIGARLNLSENLAVQARVENLFDEEIATGLSNSGLQSVGLPRSFWMNATYRF